MTQTAYVGLKPAHAPNVDSVTANQTTHMTTAIATSPGEIATRTVERTTDSCGCAHIGDCDWPDCQNGAYHGTSPLRFIQVPDHHIKPTNV